MNCCIYYNVSNFTCRLPSLANLIALSGIGRGTAPPPTSLPWFHTERYDHMRGKFEQLVSSVQESCRRDWGECRRGDGDDMLPLLLLLPSCLHKLAVNTSYPLFLVYFDALALVVPVSYPIMSNIFTHTSYYTLNCYLFPKSLSHFLIHFVPAVLCCTADFYFLYWRVFHPVIIFLFLRSYI